jgi:hypothetical protein
LPPAVFIVDPRPPPSDVTLPNTLLLPLPPLVDVPPAVPPAPIVTVALAVIVNFDSADELPPELSPVTLHL